MKAFSLSTTGELNTGIAFAADATVTELTIYCYDFLALKSMMDSETSGSSGE